MFNKSFKLHEVMCLLMRDGHLEANLQSGVSISVAKLAEAKKIALRRGVWFRVSQSG